MRFIFRSLIVLAIAVGLGFSLYYVVQSLPEDIPGLSRGQIVPGDNNQGPENQASRPEGNRPEGPEREGGRGFSPFAVIGIIGKALIFSVLTFGAVLAHNWISTRMRGKAKNTG